MYVSFQSFNEAIGVRLMQALHQYCERHNLPNFKLVMRLKFEGINDRYWDANFLRDELIMSQQYDLNKIERIWVCGPPLMNEIFDRAFFDLAATPEGSAL
jgi:hypothetical protein